MNLTLPPIRNILWLLLFLLPTALASLATEEAEAAAYLTSLESRYSLACNAQMTARWAYITNVTNITSAASTVADTTYLEFQASVQSEVIGRFPNRAKYSDPQLRRQLKFLAIKGPALMPQEDVAKMTSLQGSMETAYSTATVCEFKNTSNCKSMRLDPELQDKLEKSEDWDELAHYWTAWHDTMSNAVSPQKFSEFLALQSQMAKANGFHDMSEMWVAAYDDETEGWTAGKFKKSMQALWEELRPYYDKLAAYVRMKLRRIPEYEGKIKKYDVLPAHLLGNMWAQDWAALDSRTKPYPLAPSVDATSALLRANYTALKMFEESDRFFTGMGLMPMTETFWEKSMFERPKGRDVVCHASAEDFCLGPNSTDFRIKQCTKVDSDQLVTVHHEMGHIQYFMQYRDRPFIFRDGANPGFHEAIGDALALSVVTPSHIQCQLGLDLNLPLDCSVNGTGIQEEPAGVNVTETDINYLYLTALKKFTFLPFAISMDSWRWEAFEGNLAESEYNNRWWEVRRANQRIAPPSPRTGPGLFDPAAKYHVIANVPYIRYFASHILQFQFYEALCRAAGQLENNKPLYQCDFAGSKEAGKLLSDMMELGFSRGWPTALEKITGAREMSLRPILKYFGPLFEYIDAELKRNDEFECFGDETECEAKKTKNKS